MGIGSSRCFLELQFNGCCLLRIMRTGKAREWQNRGSENFAPCTRVLPSMVGLPTSGTRTSGHAITWVLGVIFHSRVAHASAPPPWAPSIEVTRQADSRNLRRSRFKVVAIPDSRPPLAPRYKSG